MANQKPAKRTTANYWPDEAIEILKTHYPTKSNEEVAAILGRTVLTIRSKAQRLGLKKENGRWTPEQEAKVLRDYRVMSSEELGVLVGHSRWAVINKYRELTGKTQKSKK